ncbi:conserved hypothetical protein [Sulfolobus islandicus M.14.25]|uniref:SpoVT-AbrB domain-containing protein n=1 Tax=Saccharolobus islandicus (strain M.14.25 / Kamchatka \|nr:hypothetical protein [Sulfolobus islandicus]ACP37358.1 conserved hypothetical protein [Sulfolobus islandicus M.14.25]
MKTLKPLAHKKGNHESLYILIPRDIADVLNITKDDEFILTVETKDGEIILCYKRIKKSS